MAVSLWQPGTLYQPGDIVQPITAPSPTAAAVVNGDFAAGNVNWDFTGGAELEMTGGYGNEGPRVRLPGSLPEGLALNKSKLVVPATGSTFQASAMIEQGASIAGATRGWVEVRWFDVDDVQIAAERGNVISDGRGGAWKKSTVTATRPAGAAYARAGIGLFSVADHTHAVWGDDLVVSGTFAGLPDGLVYKAVQSESGFSASDEPAWPSILGQTVIDNEVTWEAVASTRVTWEASPLYVSGTTEPDWPTEIDGFVRDGTINWKAVSRRVEDPNCPNTKIVAIAASKVFAGDDDIVRYSATVNPLDWTTDNDAGYLPTGLQNYGANPVSAMGLYRGNLVVFNSEAFQLWQVDEDPASMALIDALPLGSTEHRSIAPVSNDMLFAAPQGIRSIGIAASSTNYQAGDVGVPIDPLVQRAFKVAKANGSKVSSAYFAGEGQYMLAVADFPPAPLAISGDIPDGLVGEPVVGSYTVSGGIRPYGPIEVIQGALPPGIVLASDGKFAGTPTVAGSYTWTLRVIDGDGAEATLAEACSIGQVVWDLSWTKATIPTMHGVNGCLWSPMLGKFFGVGYYNASPYTSIVSSADGKTFVAARNASGDYWNCAVEAQGLGKVFAFGTTNVGASSADGVIWSKFALSSPDGFAATGGFGAMGWSESRQQFVGVTIAGRIYSGNNGVNDWRLRVNASSVNSVQSVVWIEELQLWVVSNGTNLYTSPDGISFTLRNTRADGGPVQAAGWHRQLGLIVAFRSGGTTVWHPYVTSPDGISWTEYPGPAGSASEFGFTTGSAVMYLPELSSLVFVGGTPGSAIFRTPLNTSVANAGLTGAVRSVAWSAQAHIGISGRPTSPGEIFYTNTRIEFVPGGAGP